MAFSFDTLVKDQKQAAVDIVDTITPSQVKQVGKAYKEGLNASPKQVINETLEQFTGVNLSQGPGAEGIGQQLKGFFEGQAGDLAMQLQQQILGCINTQIRDLMNKIPELAFALDFENQINKILGDFRNKLEQKIDGELRKLAYKKIKIHQLGLFKQRIRAKIKDICPGATPASVVEVREFNNKIKGLIEKRKSTNEVVDVGNTIPAAAITTKSKPTKQEPEAVKGPSENLKKMVREDPVGTKQLVDTKTEEAKKVVEDTAVEQLDEGDDTTIEQITETVPKEEEKQKTWSAFTFAIIKADTLNDGGESNSSNVETILNKSVPNIVSEFKNNIDNNRKWTTESETLFSDSRVQHSDKLSVGDFIASSTVRLLSYDTNRATGLKQVALSYTYKLQRKTNRFPSVVTSIAETVNGMGSNYAEANNNAFVHIENLTRRHVKKATTAV